MYYVGTEFTPDNGGYKTLPNAQKQAKKKGLNVYDESGAQVWPELAAGEPGTGQEAPEKEAAGEITAEEEKAAETANTGAGEGKEPAAAETAEDAPQEATGAPGADAGQQAEGEENFLKVCCELARMATAGDVKEEKVSGTVRVIRPGMIAIRNAPRWEAGHKCGIAKTGYTARATGRYALPDGTLYKLETGRYISGRPEDTEFIPDEE